MWFFIDWRFKRSPLCWFWDCELTLIVYSQPPIAVLIVESHLCPNLIDSVPSPNHMVIEVHIHHSDVLQSFKDCWSPLEKERNGSGGIQVCFYVIQILLEYWRKSVLSAMWPCLGNLSIRRRNNNRVLYYDGVMVHFRTFGLWSSGQVNTDWCFSQFFTMDVYQSI